LKPRLLFHREYHGYTGGHGKVFDYFEHALAAGWDARVYFTPGSVIDIGNPWWSHAQRIETAWRPTDADALFLAGTDWTAIPLELEDTIPVVNLVQGFGHLEAHDPRFTALRRSALRIAVSHPLAAALRASGEVRGEIHCIPNGLRVSAVRPAKSVPLTVLAMKRPALGREVARLLQIRGHRPWLVDRPLDRSTIHGLMAISDVVVALPLEQEGFYLPALEAMAYGASVVTIDARGNMEYLDAGRNALVCEPEPEAMTHAIHTLCLSPSLRHRLRDAGLATAERFDLAEERARFHELLAKIPV